MTDLSCLLLTSQLNSLASSFTYMGAFRIPVASLPMKIQTLAILATLSSLTHAEETPLIDGSSHPCDLLKEVGELYKANDNPYIQEVKLFGRAQWQYGYTEGSSANGEKFEEQYTELRRLRAGIQAKLLDKWELKVSANFEEGGPDDHKLGYDSFDTAIVKYSIDDTLGLEDINFTYGRQKLTVGAESHTSSKRIQTVERSNIGNFFYSGRRPTGFTASATKGETHLKSGIYSTEDDSDFIGGWNDGEAIYLGATHHQWQADLLYNNVDSSRDKATEDDIFEYRWACSLSHNSEHGRWNLLINGLYGELLSNESVYGLVIMPSTFLIEDKLEAVARYQFAGADDNTFTLTRRYAGEASDGTKGTENHTLYAGLNYYLCGHRAKIQTGVEYETLDRENGEDADATTFWAAFRMYF